MQGPGPWAVPERHPLLGATEVHVWRAALDPGPERLAALAASLKE